jgi:hypothetical protein
MKEYYPINILEKEKELLEKCLTEWESKEYPEAKKERERKLKEINKAIEELNKLNNDTHI